MLLPPFFVLCHAPYPFLPCGLVWPAQRFHCLGTLDRFAAASWRYFSGVYHLRRVMGIQLSRCFLGFVTVFFIDNPQSSC